MLKDILLLYKRLWRQLTIRRRVQFIVASLLMIVGGLAEVITLGAIIPFIAVLTEPDNILKNKYFGKYIQDMGLSKPSDILLAITGIFITIIFLSNLLRYFLLLFVTRIAYGAGGDLSVEVFRRTLYQPYIVHVSRNSSIVITGILKKASGLVNGAIQPLLMAIGSFVILVSVIVALLAIDPLVTMVIAICFGLIYLSIARLSRKKLENIGHLVAEAGNRLQQVLQEGLGGIRELLLDGTQRFYCKLYNDTDRPYRKAMGDATFISASPVYMIEIVAISLITALAYFATGAKGGIVQHMPMLGALVYGSRRLLPAMQSIYQSWSSVAAAHASLSDALDLLEQPVCEDLEYENVEPLSFEKEIRFNGIRFTYGEGQDVVIDGLDLLIAKGEKIGIIGETGSGKSTMIDLIMGLLEPSTGKILVDDREIDSSNILSWRKNIAHVPQHIFLTDSTVAENIALGIPRADIDMERVMDSARRAHIGDFIERGKMGYDAMIGERGIRLSGGQRQRIAIARALYRDARVLVLDEATSALDDKTEKAVMEAIHDLGDDLTIIIIAHRLTTLRACDRIIELKNGKIANEGSYADIIEKSVAGKD